ncbi:MAG: aromatic amino acid hydroxylase [Myxococcales bacterium]|nr:aromatic amino acid hydroxylase [Myxococcales bacterium]
MGSVETRDRVPPHLRRFVVEQDWDAYTPVDHAVWRFVLMQLYGRLVESAHPAYARGLSATGMAIERIPRIAEMDARLRDFGWGAVCVDGFIPPRAFQEFQALGILPIAADIRRVEHLAYTPAPDIIHEAGGHAPILPDPRYARFLREIGDYGMRAFGSRHDAELYEAIRRLSIVKEQRDASADEVREAEEALAGLVAEDPPPSEAAELARLYWWTVEYGLVGTPADYKLYGAGLLSSLGESHFCHDPQVRKLPLTADCVQVGYDITRPQPQLFVVRDFDALSEVLEATCAGFAFKTGGTGALETACASGEVATVSFEGGLSLIGRLEHAQRVGAGLLLRFEGACAAAVDAVLADGIRWPDGVALVVGRDPGLSIEAAATASTGPRIERFDDARVLRGETELARGSVARVDASGVMSVMRGAIDPRFWPPARWPAERVPGAAPDSAMYGLYERVIGDGGRAACAHDLGAVGDILNAEHPHEWLLRFYLLQALQRLELEPERRRQLVSQLGALETHYGGRCPIATGLRYLGHEPG